MPAHKKHPSTRRRANKASTAATLTRGDASPAPALPEREEGWHQLTQEMWADIWASPMSDEWDDSDVHNAFILAMLYDDMWRGETAAARSKAAGEYRLQRADLGLSPYSRRRLEWTIEAADEAKDKGDQRRRSTAAKKSPAKKKTATDPRAGLHAVS